MTTPSTSTAHNYQCKSGETIVVTYPSNESATVQYKASKHNLKIAVSASGSRFVGDKLEWWTKASGPGSEGTLFSHMADGTTGEIIERCTESQTANNN
ncbi:MAG: MliC family protein [Gammaproteobacteria bacterium]|nr:MliC family protein [Gammaproteobacteria bacterium]